MMCRKQRDHVETGEKSLTRDKSGGRPDRCPDSIRHEGGVKLKLGSCAERGNLCPDAKGQIEMGGPHKDESTEAEHRDGATRIRVEGSGRGPDRRGCVVQLWPGANQHSEELHG